jgi:WS/DGAT/MGAT family acyltransferase
LPDARTVLKGPLGTIKRVAWTRALHLEAIKQRGKAWGATVNDVLVAAVAGALRHYLLSRGELSPDLRAFVPVDLRGGARPRVELGNHFGMVYLMLPLAEADPVARVRAVQTQMATIKHTPEAAVAFGVLSALGATPAPLERVLVDIFGSKGSLVLTNVRGPAAPVYIVGNRLDGLMFWVPQSGHLGLGISLLSYAGEVRVGVSADAGRMPDPEALIAALEAELGAGTAPDVAGPTLPRAS